MYRDTSTKTLPLQCVKVRQLFQLKQELNGSCEHSPNRCLLLIKCTAINRTVSNTDAPVDFCSWAHFSGDILESDQCVSLISFANKLFARLGKVITTKACSYRKNFIVRDRLRYQMVPFHSPVCRVAGTSVESLGALYTWRLPPPMNRSNVQV